MKWLALLLVASLAGCAASDEPMPGAASIETPDAAEPTYHDTVRFIAWGDTGTGGDDQYRTAGAAHEVCAARGCDMVLTAGDLIYEDGVSSAYDPLFESNFELPYEGFEIPFYQTLGNHDNGNGQGTDQQVAEYQIQYHYRTDRMSEKWQLPARYYTFRVGPVDFFALDTNTMVQNGDLQHERDLLLMQQQAWLDDMVAISTAPVKVAFSHHPYISNGMHGDAGSFDGQPGNGLLMKQVFDDSVCDTMDLYIAGHDHDLQWLEAGACGDTELVVTGAAAKVRPLGENRHPTHFERGNGFGFFWFEVTPDAVTGVAYDVSGDVLFERTFSP